MSIRAIKARTVVVCALGTLFLFVFICVAQSYCTRYQAVCLSVALQKLTVGVTTEEQARDIFHHFHAEEQPVGGRVLDNIAWGPEYVASNHGLSILHLAQPTRFYISVMFSKGIVVRTVAGLRVARTGRCCVFEVDESTKDFRDLPSDAMSRGIYIRQEDGLARVYVDNETFRGARRDVFNFNAACLTSISGCTKLEQVLPHIRDTE